MASFVVDIKDTKAITGFGCNAYAVNNYTVSVSTDKTTWTELGNSAEHKTMRDDDYNNIYVLYGGVNCRYVKFEFNLNEGDWSCYPIYIIRCRPARVLHLIILYILLDQQPSMGA